MKHELNTLHLLQHLEAIVNNPFEGLIAIDENGNIVYINAFFLDILQIRKEDTFGKPLKSVIPSCRLFETVEQGYSIWGETLKIGERELLIARFPIRNDGKIVGAMIKTLFPDLTVAKEIANKIAHDDKKTCFGISSNLSYYTCMDIIGESPPMLYVKKLARQASRTSSTLLVTGESGTGKEIIAQAVHTRSVRREAPFISINCGAIPENLLESELFGYVDGAFTGAKKGGNPGKFELAHGGTILLDEIADMPLLTQVKLLNVLQDREVWRIGAAAPTKIDVRVMAATNADLLKLVRQGKFRQDLYYRLNVLEIHMPPLRERIMDLPMLTEALIKRINGRIGSTASMVTENSMRLLKAYSWPGNVRELENLLEQAINWSGSHVVDVEKIPVIPWDNRLETAYSYVSMKAVFPRKDPAQYHDIIEKSERKLILDALEQTRGNKSQAAKLLNIQRSVLYKKIGRLNIQAHA